MSKITIEKSKVVQNLKMTVEWLKSEKLTQLYVSSFDMFLNEYVPLQDCLRFYLSGFNGSVAELLVLADSKAKLYVDGRYHEQADLQVDHSVIEVVKVPYGESLEQWLLKDIKKETLGVLGQRTSVRLSNEFKSLTNYQFVDEEKLKALISYEELSFQGELLSLEKEQTGRETLEKLNMILSTNGAYWVSALDSLAWLTNLRGFQLPYQSTFKGKALATRDKVFIFTDSKNLELSKGIERAELSWHSYGEMTEVLKNISVEEVYFHPSSSNASDMETLREVFSQSRFIEKPMGLYEFQKIKTAEEIKVFEESFEKSDQAIWKSLQWLKAQDQVSEKEFNQKTFEHYKEQGAKLLSFNTISGFGPNSSIIHYGDCSDKVFAQEGDLALLDSGAFYSGGLATDTTRSLMAKGKPTEKHKLLYTTVLRSLLHCQNAVVEEGTLGVEVDRVARSVIEDAGFSYGHGTGHGLGANVHEAGYSLTPFSEVPLMEGLVGSMEPGIYLPGFGGIRLENIVVVEKRESGKIGFRSLVHIGFEKDLIDEKLMSEQEKSWLNDYEYLCKQRGRSYL